MRKRNRILGTIAALAATLALTGGAQAAAGPSTTATALASSSHWGTFTLDTPHWNALRYVGVRLQYDPAWGAYQVWDGGEDANYQVIATQRWRDVTLVVVCVPEGPHRTWISVIATSPDSAAAETERNAVRQLIIDLRLN